MDTQYNHVKSEQDIYAQWEQTRAFEAPDAAQAKKAGKQPFTIIMPPPNANDPLHVGHAMFISLEDVLIRYHRMKGDATLWLPGTDHAGIETQYVFEKKLKKQGQSRFSYDRETLYQMLWDYVQENSGTAINQMKQLGASADWSRQKFTLDEDCVDLTLATFEQMHEEGLIQRDLGLVNYCTKCGTGYSQLEIKYEERTSPLYYMQYGPFELATVRPETKFGDTAVAVHPDDTRYQQYVGQELEVDGLNGPFMVRVIADEHVDPEFGTGVVKVTPAHDPNDFAMWERHRDEMAGPKQVIGFDGKLNALTGPYEGMKVAAARKQIAEDLTAKGLMIKVDEKYQNSVATCYRCGTDIEPLPMAQFFVRVDSLTKKALASLDAGETRVHGAGHDKILRHWLETLKDWNISRQIVWGIRMPVWYEVNIRNSKLETRNMDILVGFLDDDGNYVSGQLGNLLKDYSFELIKKNLQTLTAPADATYVVSRIAPGENYLQETDTFDTWFSSSQWPVNTLKTTKPGDFDYYYPTSVMETAADILMFWVMRMMLMGIYLTGKSPFADVYLHGLVRDGKGLKMSKSKGNVINPLDYVEKYGADALRMALVMSSAAGQDASVGEDKIRGMRNFANKIWNAARFVHMQEDHEIPDRLAQSNRQTLEDNTDGKNMLPSESSEAVFQRKLRHIVEEVTNHLEKLRPGQAAEAAHNAFWHWYCDVCIEQAKDGSLPYSALRDGMRTFLTLLHPFMPFVTEACWKELSFEDNLISAPWPTH